jgi:hypothetical protein
VLGLRPRALTLTRFPEREGFFDNFLRAQAGFGGESREMSFAVGRQTNFHSQPQIAPEDSTSSALSRGADTVNVCQRLLGEASTASGEVMSAKETFSEVSTSMTVGTREAIAS